MPFGMARHTDNIVDRYHRPIVGARVTVYTQADALATCTDDSGGPLNTDAHPILTDAAGIYAYNANDDYYREHYTKGANIIAPDEIVKVGTPAYTPPTNAGAVLYVPPGSGIATTVQAALESGPLYTDQYGVKASNSAATNVTNLLALLAIASSTGRKVVVREAAIPLNANISVPVGYNTSPAIEGMGWGTGFLFTGAAVDKGFYYYDADAEADGEYPVASPISDLYIAMQSGAKRAMTFKHCEMALARRVYIAGADGAAIVYDDCIVSGVERCLLLGCGNASECAIEVTGTDGTDGGSTTWLWHHTYISGGQAPGGTGKKGGLSIDRCVGAKIDGGAIESTGLPIIVGGKTSSTVPTQGVEIGGALDLENPGNGNSYIDVGQGWAGGAGLGVIGLTLGKINGSTSGTTSIPYAVRIKNSTGFHVQNGCNLGQVSGTSAFEFVGTGNVAASIEAVPALFGDAWPWVRENGVQRQDATPKLDWTSTTLTKTVSGATPNIAILTAQGGIYRTIVLNNGGATNVTNFVGPNGGIPTGTVIYVIGDGNSTLKHGIGGAGYFANKAGTDLLLSATQAAAFVSDSFALRQL